jgi:hypothetical protein
MALTSKCLSKYYFVFEAAQRILFPAANGSSMLKPRVIVPS